MTSQLTLAPATDRLGAAAVRLYDAEVALHIARQSGVDQWIAAAYDRLHLALVEHAVALSSHENPRPHCA
jgi:hypothetical protein